VKGLVAAANRGGGEDNITAVAFQIASDAVTNLEDTAPMPALTDVEDGEPDERTREYAEIEPAGPEASDGSPQPKRVRIVLVAIAVLVVAAALVIWGLTR